MYKKIPLDINCGVKIAMEVIGGKWKTYILAHYPHAGAMGLQFSSEDDTDIGGDRGRIRSLFQLPYHPARITHRHATCRNAACDDTSSPDGRTFADFHARKYDRSSANPNFRTNLDGTY